MKLTERIEALVELGQRLSQPDEYRDAILHRTHFNNQWFTIENQQLALQAIVEAFLQGPKLEAWATGYAPLPDGPPRMQVGLVPAGNIPLVGFHDILSIFVAGQKAVIKPSEKDRFLTPYLLKLLADIDERTAPYFEITPQLKNFQAVIATGSDNSSRYFEAYFGKYPHIIRKNRNGVAVLSGQESRRDLKQLGIDVFRYFGLGCRNVSKLYVPKGYEFEPLLEALHEYRELVLHNKYKNNFDYNYALFMLNKVPFKANGCIILKEDPAIVSRIATLHFEYYDSLPTLETHLREQVEAIQCIVAAPEVLSLPTLDFGQTQTPSLTDYPDGVDTMAFLKTL